MGLICSCTSVRRYNAHIEEEISASKLKKDVDFAYKKLKKYHPKLDLYISEDQIDYKFDSFKKTINSPLKRNDFFIKFFPIFESLGHGHTDLYPVFKRLNKKEKNKYKNSKSAFENYSFFLQNDSIYLVQDFSKTNPINSSSVLLAIDDILIQDLVKKYKTSLYGDGYNKTFSDNLFNRTFLNYITLEQGIKDSVELTFLMGSNVIRKKTFRSFSKPKKEIEKAEVVTTKAAKDIQRQLKIKQKRYGYDKTSKTYSKDLSFPTNDSTIAVLKITNFRKGKIKELYKDAFTDIKNHKVKNLILDIRNNGGGYIKDAHYLYAYLVEDSDKFLGKRLSNLKLLLVKRCTICFQYQVILFCG